MSILMQKEKWCHILSGIFRNQYRHITVNMKEIKAFALTIQRMRGNNYGY